ncbi:MAG: selenide, water dikinase SelD [Betaproteobacteria bacterium]|nr:MAG: selenide, water dikinase SelD [Betaproteobacteria bacterium]
MQIRLTEYAHGGGCGCKIAPGTLSQVLGESAAGGMFPELLVGYDHADDAAVYRLNDSQALVATTDFFTPVVDDPFDFGRIAATNAISDIYAMGASPLMALAVVGMPVNKLSVEVIQQILSGGEAVCREAGIPIAGGHSIDSPEPIYGLVALGLVHPERLKRNSEARAGDELVLGKPLGVGILSAVLKDGRLEPAEYAEMIDITTRLNRPGAQLSTMADVHAITDVTGFGLLGHVLEICRGSKVAARIAFDELPFVESALRHAQSGSVTGASARNWASYGAGAQLPEGFADWKRNLLTDPQTSGGLLVCCAPDATQSVIEVFRQGGFETATRIGRLVAGDPLVEVV